MTVIKILNALKGQPTDLALKYLNQAKEQVIKNSKVNDNIEIKEEFERVKSY